MPRPTSKPPSGCHIHTEILVDLKAHLEAGHVCFKNMRLLRASVKAFAKRSEIPIKAVQSNSVRYEAVCFHPNEDALTDPSQTGCSWKVKGKAVADGIAWITMVTGKCLLHTSGALPPPFAAILATLAPRTLHASTVGNGVNACEGDSVQVSQVIEQCVREHYFINPKADIDVLQKYVYRDTKIWPSEEDVSRCVEKIIQENYEAEERRMWVVVASTEPNACFPRQPQPSVPVYDTSS